MLEPDQGVRLSWPRTIRHAWASRVRFRVLGSAAILAGVVGAAEAQSIRTHTAPLSRPNILWITSEDNAPSLGAYGDRDAITPELDKLAARGLRYTTVWSTSPVCAPARTALITGMYPASLGAEHMRSLVRLPSGVRMFPALLRQAGYYTSNNDKQDYNVMEHGDAPGCACARRRARQGTSQ